MIRAIKILKESLDEKQVFISEIIEANRNYHRIIEEKNSEIQTMYQQFMDVVRGKPITSDISLKFQQDLPLISDMGFSARTYNALKHVKVWSCKDLLAFASFNEIARIRNIGRGALMEIVDKLREYGYNGRVCEMLAKTNGSLKQYIECHS